MLRPDYALQMWAQKLNRTDGTQKVEWEILCAALNELKRLYGMELFAANLIKGMERARKAELPASVVTDLSMIAGAIESGKKSWLEDA